MPATLAGMARLAKLLHPENRLLPMLVMLVEIVSRIKLLQPEKALSPTFVMLSGIMRLARLPH